MKVELTPTPEKEKAFEPFSINVTFESPLEVCALYHRLNTPNGNIMAEGNIVYSNVAEGTWELYRILNNIMLEKGLKKPVTHRP